MQNFVKMSNINFFIPCSLSGVKHGPKGVRANFGTGRVRADVKTGGVRLGLSAKKPIRDRLQIFVSYSYREFVVLYDIDTIFNKSHTN